MEELTRAARAQLVEDATALHDLAASLLAARDAAREAGRDARENLDRRALPLTLPAAHDLTPGAEATDSAATDSDIEEVEGRLLLLGPGDGEMLRAELSAQQLEVITPPFEAWLQRVTHTFPEAISQAAPRGFFRRLFGRVPEASARDRATAELTSQLAIAASPQARHDLDRAWPREAAPAPLPSEQLRQASSAALAADGEGIAVLPTPAVRNLALTLLAEAQAVRTDRDLAEEARTAAEASVEDATGVLLTNIDMELFRARVSVGRFPTSALERAGISAVADLVAWRAEQLDGLDGVGPDTARTLAIAAQQTRRQARTQAKIDLTGSGPRSVQVRRALKALLDHRLRERGAASERQMNTQLEATARRALEVTQQATVSSPFASEIGHAPALLVGRDGPGAQALVDAASALVQRRAARRAGGHLLPEERSRLSADADEDVTAHASDYFALLTELGFEEHIAQNTHGDLPERLIRLVESVELDTELLTLESLRQYQHFAARFIVRQQRVIIGDEMGLGKTIEALAAIAHLTRTGHGHTLVICPAAVVANWIREIESKSALTAHRLHGADRDEAAASWQREGGVAVTTYETLGRLLRSGEFDHLDTVVVDEAHKIKNPSAKRSRNSRAQLERATHAILMTGTPIENRLEEFRTLIGYLDPELARSAEGLLPMAFRQHIAPAYLRRNQEDVLKELPELNEIEDWIEFSDEDRRAYEDQVAAGNFMGMRRAAMASGTRSTKIEQLQEIVEDARENRRKVIVFSFFRTVIEELRELLPGAVHGPISGAVSAARRQEIIDEFSAAPGGGVLLSQIQAGGEGLNIQAASIVVICEPQLKPSLEVQAIARAYRMGQQRSVQVHRLLSDEGVDPRIVELLGEKTKALDEYARESAAKDSDLDAVETGDVAIAKRLVAEEQQRVLHDERDAEESVRV